MYADSVLYADNADSVLYADSADSALSHLANLPTLLTVHSATWEPATHTGSNLHQAIRVNIPGVGLMLHPVYQLSDLVSGPVLHSRERG